MRDRDLPAVLQLSVRVHPTFPEGEAMFRNRLALFPAGCVVLDGEGGINGYAVSHPIRRFNPPPLDVLLDAIAPDADDYYIHDLALLPDARGTGAAREAVRTLLLQSAAFPTASLVSVYGTAPFWDRFGFRTVRQPDMSAKLAPYGPDAVYMLRRP